MSQTILYALDFDGVLCDSAVETSITGWKVAKTLWSDMPDTIPDEIMANFKRVRPALETGYEAILITRLLYEGVTAEELLNNFASSMDSIIRRDQLDHSELKTLFAAVRDDWISNNLDEWLTMNPLFEGISQKLQSIDKQKCFIVTTKQERFVDCILSANNVSLPADHIFGLDRKRSKEEILADLQLQQPEILIHFVEDRLLTLESVKQNQQLSTIKLFFADWGYNTKQDKLDAQALGIDCISLNDFTDS